MHLADWAVLLGYGWLSNWSSKINLWSMCDQFWSSIIILIFPVHMLPSTYYSSVSQVAHLSVWLRLAELSWVCSHEGVGWSVEWFSALMWSKDRTRQKRHNPLLFHITWYQNVILRVIPVYMAVFMNFQHLVRQPRARTSQTCLQFFFQWILLCQSVHFRIPGRSCVRAIWWSLNSKEKTCLQPWPPKWPLAAWLTVYAVNHTICTFMTLRIIFWE